MPSLKVQFVLAALAVSGCRCGYDGAIPTLPSKVVGSCTYVNGFSKQTECRDYLGDWTDDAATADCRDQRSTVVLGQGCVTTPRIGFCILKETTASPIRIVFPGDDAARCGPSERGCEFFGGGIFDPGPVCKGQSTEGGGTGLPTFQQPTLSCVAPKAGEPAGQSADGKVCTWSMISGATEPGRRFEDYGDCNIVRTQRPYYGSPVAADATRDDPRLKEPAYGMEVAWARQQIEATACVCCHSSKAPDGSSNWYVDQPGNFLNGFSNRGLAMGAGWIDTVGFGAYPKEQNNGFSRATPDRPGDSIFVTTDPARMAKLFAAEAVTRGLKPEDFANQKYGAGPLDDQRFYKPTACENGEGVSADGTLTWRQGPARYVYVLEAGTPSPGVPPNLDLPTGTKWHVAVPHTGNPVASGAVKYGQVPEGFAQRFPSTGSPAALERGKQYALYVLADIAVPNTRCLFTAP